MRLWTAGPDSPERKGIGNGDAGFLKDLFDECARHLAAGADAEGQ
ncbi:MAG: hypothetical protein ABSD48_17850 [Armatimonadota bacterium]